MKKQRIRDPLHNLIEFNGDELEHVLWKLLQTRSFQRLRRVKQLGFSDLVYPGATHSRFAHSVGVFHTARELMQVLNKTAGNRQQSREQRALAAALVHDLGHGPFSHAFETVGKRLGLKLADHEHVSDTLIRDGEVADVLNELGSGFAIDVADIVKKEGRITVHNAVVSSQFDADRLDYMRRDRLMTGTQHGGIDFAWLLANLEIASLPVGVDEEQAGTVDTFVIGSKAIHAAEAYVLGLFQLYPTVYFHKATRGAEKVFAELLLRVIKLTQEGNVAKTGLTKSHPLSRFALNPDQIDVALSLDDSVVWGALSLFCEAEDKVLAEFAVRLRDRKLYKCIDIRGRVSAELGADALVDLHLKERVDKCCASINKKLTDWVNASASDVPRVLIDEASRSPYKDAGGSRGPTECINVRTNGGHFVDLKSKSSVVASLADFVLLRAYCSENDSEAKAMVERVIKEEAMTCR